MKRAQQSPLIAGPNAMMVGDTNNPKLSQPRNDGTVDILQRQKEGSFQRLEHARSLDDRAAAHTLARRLARELGRVLLVADW